MSDIQKIIQKVIDQADEIEKLKQQLASAKAELEKLNKIKGKG